MNINGLPNLRTCRDALYIYKIECLENGKVYIGRSASPSCRARMHLGALKGNRHKIEDMQKDFNQYGEESFTFEVLEQCTRYRKHLEDCIDGNRERHYMHCYKSYMREYGYNYKERMRKEMPQCSV